MSVVLWRGFSALGCGGSGDTSSHTDDGGITEPDAAVTSCDPLPEVEPGGAAEHPMPLGASATEARAGRLTADAMPADATALATYAPGDFVLANDRVAALIEDVGDSDLYLPWGGGLVGVARVEDGHLVAPADFNESFIALGRYVVHATSVRVLKNGMDGGPAVVRVVGKFEAIPFIEEFGRSLAPGDYSDIDGVIDYSLEPGAEVVNISLQLGVTRPRAVRVNQVMHAFFQKFRMPIFTEGAGFGMPTGTPEYVAFTSETRTSYAWMAGEGTLTPFVDLVGFTAFTSQPWVLDPCTRTTKPFARVVIGGKDADGVRAAVSRLRDDATRVVTGTVLDGSGEPVEGAHVHATEPTGGRYLTRTTTDARGAFTLHVPASQSIELRAAKAGLVPTPVLAVAATASTATLRFAATGTLHLTANEALTHRAIPARVQVIPATPITPLPDPFGEDPPAGGRFVLAFPTNGELTIPLPPGRHRVIVSHGYEYELVDREVDVTAATTTELAAELSHVVESPNSMCADFHIHTHRSPDSGDDAMLKLASAVGDGLEIPVRTDHEWVGGFDRELAALGVNEWAFSVSGEELTTFVWGHFGVFPLTPDSRPNAGAVLWTSRLPGEVFQEVRARPEAPAIVINHPRSFGLGFAGAYFQAAGFDPVTGAVTKPQYWDEAFSLVEVFTNASFSERITAEVADWFGLLRGGRRVFAVGSSDSHHVIAGAPVGYPRTCIDFPYDDPRSLTPNAVRDGAMSGAMTIDGGIRVDATTVVGSVRPGGDARGQGARARVHVKVQAPSWVDVTRLRVFADGMETATLPLDASSMDPEHPSTRFEGDLEVDVAASERGTFVVFVAEGDADLSPVHPGNAPFGVTNPIFLHR